jgi:hypothetical protein
MITAKEARQLAGPTPEEVVKEQLEFAYERIKLAAENKRRSVNLTNEFWTRDGYSGTDEYKAAVKQLKVLGFEVEFFYEELQFVNMYTIVKW